MFCLHFLISSFRQKAIILVLFCGHLAPSPDPPGDPTVSCLRYVSEGDSVTCECQARFHDDRPPDFSLTWPGHSDTTSLSLTNVMRRDNGSVFTCLMIWNEHRRTASYTLQVAYGPDDSHTIIRGPKTFITDGTKSLILTCMATEVNPPPTYIWDAALCKEDRKAGTCTLTPDPQFDDNQQITCTAKCVEGASRTGVAVFFLNLTYPPKEPPVITGYKQGDVISHDSQLRCSVAGGKPQVSKVILTCESLVMKYSNIVNGTVSASFIVDKANKVMNNSILCTCRAVWEPEEDLYTLTSQILLQTEDGDNVRSREYVGWIGGLIIGAVLGVSISFFISYMIRRVRLKARAQNDFTPDNSATSITSTVPLMG
ncbi:uncharacterized protein LOC112568757 isoform X1 [Pomacea canaliculata]|uniref:uncharacterized protein LOC112568757 isoform X1 n=1 Tax=Pomacea canaliculata TaxID=400727 RepID=UPI000D734167|nr:uncharacterized protein LOC112568757 isoform X1 [Pomacea canaliculata]